MCFDENLFKSDAQVTFSEMNGGKDRVINFLYSKIDVCVP